MTNNAYWTAFEGRHPFVMYNCPISAGHRAAQLGRGECLWGHGRPCSTLRFFGGALRRGSEHPVNSRYPKWVALASGNMNQTCGFLVV